MCNSRRWRDGKKRKAGKEKRKRRNAIPAIFRLAADENGVFLKLQRSRSGALCGFIAQRPCGLPGWAVSSAKCNELMMLLKEVERLWHKQFGRAFPVEALARPGVPSRQRRLS
jgi:hypothetical protein